VQGLVERRAEDSGEEVRDGKAENEVVEGESVREHGSVSPQLGKVRQASRVSQRFRMKAKGGTNLQEKSEKDFGLLGSFVDLS